jgi:post-segregation antitoxin (ccd killing protein)
MTNKTTISIYIDEDIAKEIGLNISKLCENCLKQAINALGHTKIQTETNGGSDTKVWCSGRDLNPGLRLERPEYLVHANRA